MGLKRHIRIVLLGLLAVLPVQCVRDSLDGCEYESGVILEFRYVDGGGKDILAEMITEAGVYIFDTQDRLIAGRHMEQTTLHGTGKAEFALPPGDYYALAWGDRPFTEHPGQRMVMAGDLYVPMKEGEKYHYAPLQSFEQSGYRPLNISVPERMKVTYTLDFVPVYISYDVWVHGLDDKVGGINLAPRVEMTDIPDGFDFFLKETLSRNKRETGSEYTISPDGDMAAYAGFVFPYSYPGIDSNLDLYLASDGSRILTVNLLEFITENGLPARPGDHIEIYIRFSGNVLVEIGIPGWSNRPVVPEV